MHKISAIVPAAGIGRRFGEKLNKVFYRLLDKPILIWTLEVLQSLNEITEIIPVLKEEDLPLCRELLDKYNISKVKIIVPGGKERQDSVYNALKYVKSDTSIIIVHDGVRPLVSKGIIKKAINYLIENIDFADGVIVGVPVKDTLKEVSYIDKDIVVKRTLNRDIVWAIQTPQVFSYKKLKEAYEKAFTDKFYSTDDSALVERYGGNIRIIHGSYENIKITTYEDISIAEVFLKR